MRSRICGRIPNVSAETSGFAKPNDPAALENCRRRAEWYAHNLICIVSFQSIRRIFAIFFLPLFANAEVPESALPHAILRGNYQNARIKFEREKRGHVVFLGGSITQNAKGHTAMIPAWLGERFPDCEFTFTNAGLSSTCSMSGAFRLHDHVLTKGPVDLLVVEFAVNDDQDAGHAKREAIRGMEGIVQHVREHNPAAEILVIHYVNPPILEKLQNGEAVVSVEAHEAVAKRYELGSANVGAALAAGAMDWPTYGGTHPKQPGYRLASDMAISILDRAWTGNLPENAALVDFSSPMPIDVSSYSGGRFLDPATADWMGGWTSGPVSRELLPKGGIRRDYEDLPLTIASEPGATLTFNFSGTAIGAFVLAGPDAAKLEVNVDAGKWKPVELYHHYSKGLNYPRTVLFFDDLKPGFHQLSLRVAERAEGEPGGSQAALLHFAVNQ